MSKLYNDTRLIHDKIETVFEYLIVIPYTAGTPVILINFFILAFASKYWKQMRNKAENVNDANYKTATVNYVKYGLSSIILLIEIMLIISLGSSQAIEHLPCHILEYYLHECHFVSVYNKMVNTLTFVGLLLPLLVINMLSIFLIQVIAYSKVDFDVLRREGWIAFWVCIIAIALSGIGNHLISDIGTLMVSIFHIPLIYIFYKRSRKLYFSLISKCSDYAYEPKKLKYFRSQVANYKWSTIIVGISFGQYIVSNTILTIYVSIYKLIFTDLGISRLLSSQQHTYYEIIHYKLLDLTEISLISWAFVSTLLNYVLLIMFVRKAILYRRFMSKPIHYKMMFSKNGRIAYKRVPY